MKTNQELESIISTLLEVIDTLVDFEIEKGNNESKLLNECKEVVANIRNELNTLK